MNGASQLAEQHDAKGFLKSVGQREARDGNR